VEPVGARRQLGRLHGFVANAAGRLGHGHGYSSSLDRMTRTVVDGFILPERDLLRDKEKRQAQVNATAYPLKNPFKPWCACSGISAVLTCI
jgi:hypothetical protein